LLWDTGHWPVSSDIFKFRVGNFHNNKRGFASWSSQTAARVKSADLFVSQPGSSTQIHLWIGMGLLCNVPVQTPHKGLHEIYVKYQKKKEKKTWFTCFIELPF
jgi:hypothetical protein